MIASAELLSKASAMLALGEINGAIGLLGVLCVQDEFDAEAHALLGHAYLAAGEPGLALAPLKKALHLHPEHPAASRDLNTALRQAKEAPSRGPWDDKPELPTALAVGVAVMFGAAPLAALALALALPGLVVAGFLVLVGLAALAGWTYLVACARISRPNGRVLIHGRRSILSYWRHGWIPLLLLIAILLLALAPLSYTLIPIVVLAFLFKGCLAVAALLCAPGARPLYMIVDHMHAGRRCLVVKQMQGLRQAEFQLLSARLEQVWIERDFMDVLLGLWTLRVAIVPNAIPGLRSFYIDTPGHHRDAARWRNEITRLISDGRRFVSNGGTL